MKWNFGWKKQVEQLRMTILSASHQLAEPLSPQFLQVIDLFRRADKTKDGSTLLADINSIPPSDRGPLWEPAEIHGWQINATTYLDNGQLWWLLRAARKNERPPSENDTTFLDKVLAHLGADPDRDTIIGPRSSPPGEPPLPFGWFAWFNRWPLYEVQTKGWKSTAQMRIVPIDTPLTDGWQRVDLSKKADLT